MSTANSTFEDDLLTYIADCMCVADKKLSKADSIRLMCARANEFFAKETPTPEKVEEVKKAIMAAI